VEDGGGAVGQGQFVIAGGQASPLLDDVEAALDDVAALVVCSVERPVVVRRESLVSCGARLI
jgi:hypothetical protein